MPTFTQAPSKQTFIKAVYDFFRCLSKNDQAGARALLGGLNGRQKNIDDDAWRQMMRSLWEDVEDWHEDFDDARFEGAWLTHLTPPDLVSEPSLLAVEWTGAADPMEEGDGLLINVFFLDEPTDDTARFSTGKDKADQWLLLLDNIEVM
ncbi:MAG: hypothetical protein JRF33_21340 [Deltaproteobacteria bacterium]|nr:hypothetical protein [Deltaproteobacteria bacterium]